MRVLAISSASGGCRAAIVRDGIVLAHDAILSDHGLAAAMSPMVAGLVTATGFGRGGARDLIAVVVGPGSFTGLRAGISLAAGLSLGASVPLAAVTVAEALAMAVSLPAGRRLWTCVQARRDRIFIADETVWAAWPIGGWPMPAGPIALAGDAAGLVAGWLAARGADVMLTDARRPLPLHVAMAGAGRAAGALPPLDPVPLYIDPPAVSRPAAAARPAPQ